ncbi:MAG: toll/interleukin-1 receptor domain-containing protein [Elusimicrobia bacterium]|nr:toll/interleukin-1 receptor domain-containing protein [Elusimicrobiota bacterium]
MGHIFISHVGSDEALAVELARGLESAGYQTWYYERDSMPGASYLLQTGQAVEDSAAVVVLVTPRSIGSNQVTKEVVRAHEGSKPFIPVLQGITHAEFQQRQPEWREAMGAAASIQAPAERIGDIVPRIVGGLAVLKIPRAVRLAPGAPAQPILPQASAAGSAPAPHAPGSRRAWVIGAVAAATAAAVMLGRTLLSSSRGNPERMRPAPRRAAAPPATPDAAALAQPVENLPSGDVGGGNAPTGASAPAKRVPPQHPARAADRRLPKCNPLVSRHAQPRCRE